MALFFFYYVFSQVSLDYTIHCVFYFFSKVESATVQQFYLFINTYELNIGTYLRSKQTEAGKSKL